MLPNIKIKCGTTVNKVLRPNVAIIYVITPTYKDIGSYLSSLPNKISNCEHNWFYITLSWLSIYESNDSIDLCIC